MTTNKAAEAARAVQGAWRTGRLVLGAYLVIGTLVLCLIAVADPVLFLDVPALCLIPVPVSILVPQYFLHRYRMARGKKLAEATSNTERYDLTSPDIYYNTSHRDKKSSARSRLTGRFRSLVPFRYLVLMLAGSCVAMTVSAAIVNRAPVAATIATVTQCTSSNKGYTTCSGTWTVAGRAYSGVLPGTGGPSDASGMVKPAAGSSLVVAYNTRYPGVLGQQDIGGGVTCVVLFALIGFGLGFWNNSWCKPYRAELDAIAAGPGAETAGRRPAPDKPPARDGRRTSRKHGQ